MVFQQIGKPPVEAVTILFVKTRNFNGEIDRLGSRSAVDLSLFERLLIETGPEADARRTQALPLWGQDASRRIDTFASGPDHHIDEAIRRRFFGEE